MGIRNPTPAFQPHVVGAVAKDADVSLDGSTTRNAVRPPRRYTLVPVAVNGAGALSSTSAFKDHTVRNGPGAEVADLALRPSEAASRRIPNGEWATRQPNGTDKSHSP